jgi:hypothetical protein
VLSIPEQLEHWPLSRLIEYARNPRKNDHAVDMVAAAIHEFGFRVPVIARSDGTVVDGHLRLKAARKLGLETVPVLLADDLTDIQIKAFRLSVNKLAELAGWDEELLALELADLDAAGFDLELTGFNEEEIGHWLSEVLDNPADETNKQPADAGDDDIPPAPVNPVSRSGDVWLIGRHRLVCGDAADTGVIATLMQGQQANLLFTSPPFYERDPVKTLGPGFF